MKKFNNYDEAKKSAEFQGGEQLPEGAYVCKIMAVRYQNGKDGNSDILTVQFDISEGEHKDFFRNQYEGDSREDKKWKGKTNIFIPKDDGSEKDQWTKTAFARWTNAIEDSNPGYQWDWDENKWKDKMVGIVFGITGTKIEGKDITYTEARFPISAEKARKGDYRPAKFKSKNGYKGSGSGSSSDEGWVAPSASDAEEIPF